MVIIWNDMILIKFPNESAQKHIGSNINEIARLRIPLVKYLCLPNWFDLKFYMLAATYIESSLPIGTGIFGPPQTETATAPPKAIISAHDTNNTKIHTS